MKRYLSGAHMRTHDMIFQHPISHNLEWRDVKAMFEELGEVEQEHNGHLKITINGNVLLLVPPHGKDLTDLEQIMHIRHFLETSGHANEDLELAPRDILIVVDHAEALIYKMEMEDERPVRLAPHDPHGLGRHFHTIQTDISTHEKANRRSFYEGIVKSIHGAERILVLGDGTGSSSEMTLFLQELEENHPKIAALVCGSSRVDLGHITEPELLAEARAFFEQQPALI